MTSGPILKLRKKTVLRDISAAFTYYVKAAPERRLIGLSGSLIQAVLFYRSIFLLVWMRVHLKAFKINCWLLTFTSCHSETAGGQTA